MPAILIYDEYCPFCVKSARRLQRWAGAQRLELVSLDAPGAMKLHAQLDYKRALAAVQLILPDGSLSQGAEAAAQALSLRPGFSGLKFIYYTPVLRQLADLSYRAVALLRRRRCDACNH